MRTALFLAWFALVLMVGLGGSGTGVDRGQEIRGRGSFPAPEVIHCLAALPRAPASLPETEVLPSEVEVPANQGDSPSDLSSPLNRDGMPSGIPTSGWSSLPVEVPRAWPIALWVRTQPPRGPPARLA